MVHRPHRVWLLATSQLPLPHTSSWLLSSHSGQRSLSRAKFTPPLALLSTGILSRLSTHLSFTLKYLFRLHLLAVPFSGCLISPTLPSLFLIFETLVTNVILSVLFDDLVYCLFFPPECKLHKGREFFCFVHCYVPII